MPMKCKCNIISFGEVNLYMLLILLGAAFKVVKEIILTQSKKLNPEGLNVTKKQHPIIITINYAMGLCLSFILFFIYKIWNKRRNKTNILPLDKMTNIQNKNITKKEKYLWILLVSPFDFFANLIYSYDWIKKEEYLCLWSTNILLIL